MREILGDILHVTSGVIVHQVNLQRIMGAGLALQIRKKYPIVYQRFLTNDAELGDVLMVKVTDDLWVANLYGQEFYGSHGRYTDYDAVEIGLTTIAYMVGLNPIYIPFNMGCGLAGGSWPVIYNLIESILPDAIIVRR